MPADRLRSRAADPGGFARRGIGLDNRLTFCHVPRLLDDVILLTRSEIAAGIRHAYAQEREIVEGAGAVASLPARRQGQGERTGGGSPLRPKYRMGLHRRDRLPASCCGARRMSRM